MSAPSTIPGLHTSNLRDNHVLISLHPEGEQPPVTVSLVVRKNADPIAGHLVLLQHTAEARVYLGCLADAAGKIIEWLEIWVQSLEQRPSEDVGLSNWHMDVRWHKRAELLAERHPDEVINTPWQTQHPWPVYLDLHERRPVCPVDRDSGQRWTLCADDQILAEAKLPLYARSYHRYLYIPARGSHSVFVPMTPGAPENKQTRLASESLNLQSSWTPFNPASGLLLVRRFAPLSLDDFVRLLGGQQWRGLGQAKEAVVPEGVYSTLLNREKIQHGAGHLFRGRVGLPGRLTETLYLKVHLWRELFALVRGVMARETLPFINLTADSFRVRLSDTDGDLPFFWTARPTLAHTAESAVLPINVPDAHYYKLLAPVRTSVYRPAEVIVPTEKTGTVRIREAIKNSDGTVIIEGTLVTGERLATALSDLLFFQLVLGQQRLDFYARVSSADGLAQGEARFRSLGMTLQPEQWNALDEARGVPLPRTPFELQPVLRSPCDLYALAVIGVQILLVNGTNSLPVALDECLSLARQIAIGHRKEEPLLTRLLRVVAQDKRWSESLGPHRLSFETLDPALAARLVPDQLWWRLLALLVRLFPGIGPDSFCRDYGDVSHFALESVFDEPLKEMDALLTQMRSLVLTDWQFNREVAQVIDGLRHDLSAKHAPPGKAR